MNFPYCFFNPPNPAICFPAVSFGFSVLKQAQPDNGIPLSGVPANAVIPLSPNAYGDPNSPRAPTAAAFSDSCQPPLTPTDACAGASPTRGSRKGKYQVKDSFNRLRGWINGGFSSGNSRKNAGSVSPSPKGAKGKGSSWVKSKNQMPNAMMDKTVGANAGTADTEAQTAEHDVLKAGAAAAKRGRRSPRRATKGSPNRGPPRNMSASPRAVNAIAAAATPTAGSSLASSPVTPPSVATGRVNGRTFVFFNGSGDYGQMAGGAAAGSMAPAVPVGAWGGSSSNNNKKGLSHMVSPAYTPQNVVSDDHMDSLVGLQQDSCTSQQLQVQPHLSPTGGNGSGVAGGGTPRKCKLPASAAATAAAAVAVCPASGRMAVAAPVIPSGPSRVKTAKAARSLGASIPPLSAASRAASNSSINSGNAAGSSERGLSKSAKSRSGKNMNTGTSTLAVEPSDASTKSPKGKGKAGSKSGGGKMALRATSSPKK